MKRILITGKTSWIGDELERHLQNFPNAYVVERVSLRDSLWETANWDDYDSVVHTAAIAHDGEEDERCVQDVNVELTRKVGLKAKQHGVPHMIFLSSFHVYAADKNGDVIVDQSTKPNPTTLYGKSKLAAEGQLAELQDKGFSVAILRPPLVYGPYCTKRNFPRFIKLASITPIFPNVANKRSMIYSRNLAELMRLLLENGDGGIYLPQNENLVCTSDMIVRIGEELGRRIRLSNALAPAVSFLARRKSTLGKLFGNAYYMPEISKYKYNYQIVSYGESIRESVARRSAGVR